ncbi:MAG: hypothetical protein ACP5U0_10110 [Caldisphaera sp.]
MWFSELWRFLNEVQIFSGREVPDSAGADHLLTQVKPKIINLNSADL